MMTMNRLKTPNQALQRTDAAFFVIPSEVEESLDISDHAAVGNIEGYLQTLA